MAAKMKHKDSNEKAGEFDATGSPVAVVKLDGLKIYDGISTLLKDYIDRAEESSWEKITGKIDYLYENIVILLDDLNRQTGFGGQIKTEVGRKKLLFKPNMVIPTVIDGSTHYEGPGSAPCTHWYFLAAVMRWFHDVLRIDYSDMSVGEAATAMSVTAAEYSMLTGNKPHLTTEAIIEGRSGDFYGGWGFYFTRRYLQTRHPALHTDNPMNGYQESIEGKYLPPGKAGNRLMVYDLNRLYDDADKQRTVPVPGGGNFKEITLHKVIIGGDPADKSDISDYPGCILINVPRLRVHGIDLITGAMKNLGIGLYPMEVSDTKGGDNTRWKYAFPLRHSPGMKSLLPHSNWKPRLDMETGLPLRDSKGNDIVDKTQGMKGTQADVLQAVADQGVRMLHVVDFIESLVADKGRFPESLVFASPDPLAVDVLGARYLFKMMPWEKSKQLQETAGIQSEYIQKVPLPVLENNCIVNREGFDTPLIRYPLFDYMEKRGIGQQHYTVSGWNTNTHNPIVSREGHLGEITQARFSEIITEHLYYSILSLPWYLQKTILKYLEVNDRLTGSAYLPEFLNGFDENNDGVVDFDELGKNGFWHIFLSLRGYSTYLRGVEPMGVFHSQFTNRLPVLKYMFPEWNAENHDFMNKYRFAGVSLTAYHMSRATEEKTDELFPAMTWGNGKWPSFQYATQMFINRELYGASYPEKLDLMSLYGAAFQYADKLYNQSAYTAKNDAESLNRYVSAVKEGTSPLPFCFYVPAGFNKVGLQAIPNTTATSDPAKIFTVIFQDGAERW